MSNLVQERRKNGKKLYYQSLDFVTHFCVNEEKYKKIIEMNVIE